MNDSEIKRLESAAQAIRCDVIKMTRKAGRNGAHIGGGLSMCEILSVLYLHVMNVCPDDILNPERDRFILSKGHGAIALYAAMKQAGFLTEEDLCSFKMRGSDFWTHPRYLPGKGFEFTSGSLGMGLSLGAGTAFALRKRNSPAKVFVYVGDGECNEGAIWEAAAFVAHHKLINLTVIIDKNNLQLDAPTKDIIDMRNMNERWQAFGFETVEADGHSVESLISAFAEKPKDRPIAIIANTVKGKGVSFIENNPAYHMNILTEAQYKQAMLEQGVSI